MQLPAIAPLKETDKGQSQERFWEEVLGALKEEEDKSLVQMA